MAVIRVLGLDPSLTHTGWCVADIDTETCAIVRIVDMGTVVTEKGKVKNVRKSSDDLERARAVVSKVNAVIREYGIKVGASEVPSGAQSASAARAFGIVVGLLASLPVPLIEVSFTEVKMASVGKKTADKEDIVRWAVEMTANDDVQWNTSKSPNDWEIPHRGGYVTKTMEHQADSVAAVQAAVQSQQFRQLAAMMNSLAPA